MKAVVTGATGLVGQYLVRELLQTGKFSEILALGRNEQTLNHLQDLGSRIMQFDLLLNDFNELKDWTGDSIWFHCAAAISGADKETLESVNIKGTQLLIDFLTNNPISKIIHVSSIAIYGLHEEGMFKEDLEKYPSSNYAKTKHIQEQLITNSKLNWIVFRPPFIGGPNDKNFLFEFANRITNKKMPSFTKSGSISYIDVRDLCRGMVQSAIIDDSHEIYNIKGFNFIFDEFVKLFAKLLKIEPPYGKKYNYSLVMGLAVFLEIYYKLTGNSNERKLSRYRIRTLTSQRTLDDSKFREKYMFTPNISPEKSIQDWIQVANNE